jgi:hypothetical protein
VKRQDKTQRFARIAAEDAQRLRFQSIAQQRFNQRAGQRVLSESQTVGQQAGKSGQSDILKIRG